MKNELKYSVLVAALLALGLAGCQRQEEVPAPDSDTTVVVPPPDSDVPGSEVPAPEAVPEPAPVPPSNMNEMPPAETMPPPESAPGTPGAPGEMSDTPTTPAQ